MSAPSAWRTSVEGPRTSILGHESPCPTCQTDGEKASENGHSRPNALNMSGLPSASDFFGPGTIR